MIYDILKNYILIEIEYIEFKNHRKKMNTKDYYKRKYYYEILKKIEEIEKLFKESK